MKELHIDFETYSAVDLRSRGLDVYASDKTTGVHCMAWMFTDGADSSSPVELICGSHDTGYAHFYEADNESPHYNMLEHVAGGGIVVAHNAAFEFAIWNKILAAKYGWPLLRLDQMRCTMAQAYALGLPGALEKLAPALGLDTIKDMHGKRVMLKLANVKEDGSPYVHADLPEQFDTLYDYCKQDVRVEVACDSRMLKLSPAEHKVWVIDQEINNRGIPLDIPTIKGLNEVVNVERGRLDARLRDLTDGAVQTASSVKALTAWLAAQGVEVPSLGKADVQSLLSLDTSDLPPMAREALVIRKEAAKSSTAKLDAMLDAAGEDDRVRGAMQYHGAATGRWAGRKVQFQNMPRPRVHSPDDYKQEAAVADIVRMLADRDYEGVDMLYGPIIEAASDALRGMIKAGKGKRLIAADYSSIEARVLPWLAGQENVLDIFRSGQDIYLHAATDIYKRKITKKDKSERQIGKVAVLALGYQGGVGAFQNMARAYGVKVSDKEADDIKTKWREANQEIVAYWADLELAAHNAVKFPREKFYAGYAGREVCFRVLGSFLYCRLPSGRVLSYPYPKIKPEKKPWGSSVDTLYYKSVDSVSNKWVEVSTYGGSLCENITQAVARDVLANALVTLSHHGYDVIFHVHDEIVCEMAEGKGSLAEMISLMCELPEWAEGLPINAEGFEDYRYRK